MQFVMILFILGALAAPWAEGKSDVDFDPFKPTIQELKKKMSQYDPVDLPKRLLSKDARVFYAPTESLVWSQPEVALLKVIESIQEAQSAYNVKYDDGRYLLDHDDGASVFPDNRSIKVVRFQKHLYIIDGHHKHATSIFFGAKTVPVEVIADYSDLTEKKVHKKLVERGLAYGFEADGSPSDHFWLPSQVVDNEMLYLARLIEHKIKLEIRFGELRILSHSGADWPLLLKLNEDVPFLEFFIAKALTDAGMRYNPKWGNELPKPIVAEIRDILIKASRQKDSPLGLALILSEDLNLSRLDRDSQVRDLVMELILKHFGKRSKCSGYLTPRGRDEND